MAQPARTSEHRRPILLDDEADAPAARRRLIVESFGMTDRGRERSSNEDQFLIATLTRALRINQTSIAQSSVQYAHEEGHVFVVADGMGGHRGGREASELAVGAIEQFVLNTVTWLLRRDEAPSDVLHELRVALRRANAKVLGEAARNPDLSGMGTTLTMAYGVGSELFIAHVGDSRCYLLREGQLHLLTRDHTLVTELVAEGVIAPEDAEQHPFRHLVTNAVGGDERAIRTEVHRMRLEPRDVVLLCTDGLTQMVSEERIAQVLARASDPRSTCKQLVAEANEAGGRDNVTVVVARYDLPAQSGLRLASS